MLRTRSRKSYWRCFAVRGGGREEGSGCDYTDERDKQALVVMAGMVRTLDYRAVIGIVNSSDVARISKWE